MEATMQSAVEDLIQDVYESIAAESLKLLRCTDQISVMETKLNEAKERYDRAMEQGSERTAGQILMQMSVLDGVRLMFEEYAVRKTQDIIRLHDVLQQGGVEEVYEEYEIIDDDDDWEDDSESESEMDVDSSDSDKED
jgi:hypothetical protein